MGEPARIGRERVTQSDIDAVMDEVPKGALALAGIAVLLILAGWFFVYFAIFIPRGMVG
jgi:hypothetical protein